MFKEKRELGPFIVSTIQIDVLLLFDDIIPFNWHLK